MTINKFYKNAAIRLFTATLALGVLSPGVEAAELTTREVIARALRENPDLAAAKYRIEEARGRLRAAGVRPNPEIQVEADHNPGFPEGSLMVGWVQKFPAAAKLKLEKEISLAMLDAAIAEVRVAERTLQIKALSATVRLLALDAQDSLRLKQTANAEEMAEAAARRAEKGEGSGLEAAQFELEAQQLSLEAMQISAQRAEAAGELRQLLALPVHEPITIKGSLSIPLSQEVALSTASRPEHEVAAKQEAAANLMVDLENAKRREDISGGIFAGVERTHDAPEGYDNQALVGFRVTIPFSLRHKNEGRIQEAAAAASRLAAERKALALRITSENETSSDRIQRLAQIILEIDNKLLPKSIELEQKLRDAYDKGLLPTINEVLRAREKRLQLEHSRLETLRDLHLLRVQAGHLLPESPNDTNRKQ